MRVHRSAPNPGNSNDRPFVRWGVIRTHGERTMTTRLWNRDSGRRTLGRAQLVRVAGALTLSLAACGGSSGPETLALVAGGGTAKNGALGTEAGMSSDSRMTGLAIWNVKYEVKENLPDLGDSAGSWKLRALKKSSVLTRVKRIAASLGVKGSPVSADKMSYSIGVDEKTGAGVWVYLGERDASWSYYSGAGQGGYATSCVKADDGTAVCADTKEPTKPKNLPTKDEALARAREVIEASGEDVSDFSFTATADDWSSNVQAIVRVDGTDTPYGWWFGFGEDGALVNASGTFISAAKGSNYPLVSATDAVTRLESMNYGYWGAGPGAKSAVDSRATVGGDASTDSPSTDGEAVGPPEPTIVTITGARLTLMPAYLADGRVVLLPAYTYSNGDGDIGTVFAIEDKYLTFTEPTPDTTPGTPGTDVPADGTGSGASSGSGGGAVDPGTGGGAGVMEDPTMSAKAEKMIGLSEDEAMKVADSEGWLVRVAERDGETFMLTADYNPQRVNLTIKGGTITDVSIG